MQLFFQHHPLLMLIFLIIMGFCSGFIDAIAGGGGLISIPALTFTGMPISLILGTNKLQSTIGTCVATYRYYQAGFINWQIAMRGLVMGLFGSLLGAICANKISNSFMSYIIPILLLGVFILNLVNPKLGISSKEKRMNEISFFNIFGFMLSFYDAFAGPGTGTFWLFAIVFFLGYDFLQASGYAKILNLKSDLFALVIFIYYANINWRIALIMAMGQLIGGYSGAKIVLLRGAYLVRPIFLIIVGVNLLVIFYQLLAH